jgi:hypothetical protein
MSEDLSHWDLAEKFSASQICYLMMGREPVEDLSSVINNPIYQTICNKSSDSLDLLIRHANAFYEITDATFEKDFGWFSLVDYKVAHREYIDNDRIKKELDLIVDRRVQATDKWITSIKFWEVWNSLRNTLSIRDTFEPKWKVQNKYFCGYDELAISDPYEWVKREFECFVLKKYELSWTDYFIRDEVARWIGDNNLNSKYNFNLESKRWLRSIEQLNPVYK